MELMKINKKAEKSFYRFYNLIVNSTKIFYLIFYILCTFSTPKLQIKKNPEISFRNWPEHETTSLIQKIISIKIIVDVYNVSGVIIGGWIVCNKEGEFVSL